MAEPPPEEGRAVRYLLVTLEMPDGSNKTPDPEKLTEQFERYLRDLLWGAVDPSDCPRRIRKHVTYSIAQAYPDDAVGGGD